MSLFRKLRRRHKAFVLKRSKNQIHSDNAASVFPTDDGEGRDEDEDIGYTVNLSQQADEDSSQQADEQNGDASAGHEIHQMSKCIKHFPLQAGSSYQPSNILSAISGIKVGQDMQTVGKESRYWFRISKTVALLIITAGAFCFGKLATVGITLTMALAFKLFGRGRTKFGESFISAEAEQSSGSNKSFIANTEVEDLHREETALIGSKALLVDESNGAVKQTGSDLLPEAIGLRHESLNSHSEEALDFKASGDSLLSQRKKLKRLYCIKIPPSTSPFIETVQDSPSSSSKASPRSWFCSVRNSTAAGKGIKESFTEIDNQEKLKSKVLLRHLRRKGEPLSAPSSPFSSSREERSNFLCIASDGSDTERSAHRMTLAHRRSKFRPASPAKVANASMGVPEERIYQTSPPRKGKRTPYYATLLANEAMATDVPDAAMQKHEMQVSTFTPVAQECSTTVDCVSTPSETMELRQSMLMPGTPRLRDVSTKVDVRGRLLSSHELPHQAKEKERPVSLVSQEDSTLRAVAPWNQDSVSEQGNMWRKHFRVGSPSVAAAFMIMLAGLFVGRMAAVTGLVCYWYSLPLRTRKVTES